MIFIFDWVGMCVVLDVILCCEVVKDIIGVLILIGWIGIGLVMIEWVCLLLFELFGVVVKFIV